MGRIHESLQDLRSELDQLLGQGMAEDPIEHARQVAEIAGILHSAFEPDGFEVTMVGGSAIEVHAPGIYRSGDLDLVIERASGNEARRDEIFKSLGFERTGRHWRRGDQLFVELVSGPVAGPAEEVRVGGAEFRVVKKEVVLRDRLVGFKHWKHTAYGEQAIDMLAAFEGDLDMSWLGPELQREDAFDALEQLRKLASSDEPVTDQVLREMIDELHRRP
jgi:hypothetical protein